MTKISSLSASEAKKFFLKGSSYCNFDLPKYITFEKILDEIDKKLKEKNYRSILTRKPSDYENVNYKIITNKDGKFSWRPLELIHPVLYVSLANTITEEKN